MNPEVEYRIDNCDNPNGLFQFMSSKEAADQQIDTTGWLQGEDGIYRRLHPITESIISAAAQHIGLFEITEDNAHEWYYRLRSVSDAGIALLTLLHPSADPNNPDPIPTPYVYTWRDITRHIGLLVIYGEGKQYSPSEFDQYIRHLRTIAMRDDIEREQLLPLEDDPYAPDLELSTG